MIFNFLAAATPAIKESVDSVKTALLDTAGKSAVEKDFITTIDTLTSTPTDQIIASLGEKALQFGLKVVAALVIYAIGAWLIRIAKKTLRKFFEKKNTEPAIVSFSMSLVTALFWVILVILVVGALGVETTSLAALLAAGGMAIGMALSGTVQNFAGGVMILIFKPFKAGDYIEAQGYAGTVSDVTITATKIITVDNKVVILPNGPLSSGSINNYSKEEYRRVDINVCVEYGSDTEVVKETLLAIAKGNEKILDAAHGAPADPFAAICNLSPSSVDFTFRLWTKSADYWDVFFYANEAVYKEIPQHGIYFPYPQLKVHMEK